MRKPLRYLVLVVLGLSLAACSTTKQDAVTTTAPRSTPMASATPSSAAAAKEATPSRTIPLVPLTDSNILGYCPNIPAVHFDGKTDDVTKVTICTSITSATGRTESANWVNFGQDALLSAYSETNAQVTPDSCIRTAKDPLLIWLTRKDGTIYPVYAPVDACGYPNADSVAAYNATGQQILYEADLDANGNPTTP